LGLELVEQAKQEHDKRVQTGALHPIYLLTLLLTQIHPAKEVKPNASRGFDDLLCTGSNKFT
jgi:hypothetical protein